jgi:hypothetical protein
MLLMGGPPAAVTDGAIYGLATACFWVGLQAVVG